MSETKTSKLLAGIDVEAIIKKSIESHVTKETTQLPGDELMESYVAEPKKFKQVTEFVSQKTKDSHTTLYKGYIESLNKVSVKLDSVDRGDVNSRHSDYRSHKLDETYNLNATWLHELYFANCFDPHSEVVMDSSAFLSLQKTWGTFDDWQRDFMACAMAAGNGWAVCGYNIFLKNYVNTFVSSHSQDVMVGLYPIIVLDMWEHSYYKDYTTDKKSYIVSQMREFNWTVIEERFKKSKSLEAALK